MSNKEQHIADAFSLPRYFKWGMIVSNFTTMRMRR